MGRWLHQGTNVLALEVSNNDRRDEKRLVAKLIQAGPDQALLLSGLNWKGTLHAQQGWQDVNFNDTAWPPVAVLGAIESNIDFLQWNDDDGLYDWPGCEGSSPFLAHLYLPAVGVRDVYAGQGSYENLETLESSPQQDSSHEFMVELASTPPHEDSVPGISLDFGREVAGRNRADLRLRLSGNGDDPVWRVAWRTEQRTVLGRQCASCPPARYGAWAKVGIPLCTHPFPRRRDSA